MESYVGVKRKNVVVGGDVGREMPVAPPSSSSAAVGMVEFPAAAAGLGYAGMTAKEAGGGYQERRVVVGEMDFFKTAEKRGERKEPPPATATAAASGHAGASPDDLSLNKDDLTINVTDQLMRDGLRDFFFLVDAWFNFVILLRRRWDCSSAGGGTAAARNPSSTMAASPPTTRSTARPKLR
jgi:hypothetical protein